MEVGDVDVDGAGDQQVLVDAVELAVFYDVEKQMFLVADLLAVFAVVDHYSIFSLKNQRR